ncbi:hypothetical protein FHG87_007610 [Trinorchestia longiramus]|nr:hypothetical protein FHG87_007610 [Trinorchestia longiramus]
MQLMVSDADGGDASAESDNIIFFQRLSSVVVLSALLSAAVADTRPYGAADNRVSDDQFETPKYEFAWGVKDDDSGNMFNQVESRDDDTTRGAYYVALPDGRLQKDLSSSCELLQKVTYYVDGDSGFVAEVSYEGEARYPEGGQEVPYDPQYS